MVLKSDFWSLHGFMHHWVSTWFVGLDSTSNLVFEIETLNSSKMWGSLWHSLSCKGSRCRHFLRCKFWGNYVITRPLFAYKNLSCGFFFLFKGVIEMKIKNLKVEVIFIAVHLLVAFSLHWWNFVNFFYKDGMISQSMQSHDSKFDLHKFYYKIVHLRSK